MTAPQPEPKPADTIPMLDRWTVRQWLEEAADQYQDGLKAIESWRKMSQPGSHEEVIMYKAAANHMQAAAAASSIAAGKMMWG